MPQESYPRGYCVEGGRSVEAMPRPRERGSSDALRRENSVREVSYLDDLVRTDEAASYEEPGLLGLPGSAAYLYPGFG